LQGEPACKETAMSIGAVGPAAGFSFAAPAKPGAAVQAFLDYQKKTPAEKMRDEILGAMGLTEDQLKAMDPKERAKIEEKVRELIKQKVEESTEKKTGQIVDVKA
jgi:hypothetical protein